MSTPVSCDLLDLLLKTLLKIVAIFQNCRRSLLLAIQPAQATTKRSDMVPKPRSPGLVFIGSALGLTTRNSDQFPDHVIHLLPIIRVFTVHESYFL
jgi:hypothetical protein